MIGLIALDSLIYSARLAIRKNYIFNYLSPIGHMFYGNLCTFLFLGIWYMVQPKTIMSEKDYQGIKKMGVKFFIIQVFAFLNYLLFLNLIDKNEISYLVPLNQLFVILFSSGIGILFLNEKITTMKIIGIVLGSISIYMINC